MAASQEEKKKDKIFNEEYILVSLPDNNNATLTQVRLEIKEGNAVLIYPDTVNNSHYKACFIRKGHFVITQNNSKEPVLKEVTLENIENIQKNHSVIMQLALSKAGLRKNPTLVFPTGVTQHMLKFLDIKHVVSFAITSTRARENAAPIILQKAADKLIGHIINGEENEALAMLDAKPGMFLVKGTAKALAGQTCVKKTPLQAMGWADESDMLAWAIPLFDKKHGAEEGIKQYNNRASEAEHKNETQRCRDDIQELNKVIQALQNAKVDVATVDNIEAAENAVGADCQQALNAFHTYLENQAKRTDLENQFNLQLLVKAFELYEQYYRQFGDNCGSPKNRIFWVKIIGYIQRFVPTSIAQAICQGIYNITDKGEKLNRSLKFRYDNHISYFDFARSLLGEKFALVGPAGAVLAVARQTGMIYGGFFKTYASQKLQRCKMYAAIGKFKTDSMHDNVVASL